VPTKYFHQSVKWKGNNLQNFVNHFLQLQKLEHSLRKVPALNRVKNVDICRKRFILIILSPYYTFYSAQRKSANAASVCSLRGTHVAPAAYRQGRRVLFIGALAIKMMKVRCADNGVVLLPACIILI
jgi:hypothetical protein